MGEEEYRQILEEIEGLRRMERQSWLDEVVWLARVKWLKVRLLWRRWAGRI